MIWTLDRLRPVDISVLEQLHPELREKIEQVILRCEGRLRPICGYRDPHVQLERYKVGRIVKLAPDGVTVLSSKRNGDKVVTHALPMHSPHNYDPSLAVDCVLSPDLVEVGLHPDDPRIKNLWETRRKYPQAAAAWAAYGEAVQAAGLVWGGAFKSFKDLPHAELRNWRRYI